MMAREAEIEMFISRQVKAMGGLSFKWVSPGNDGVPDRILIMPGGRIIFVELKSETGTADRIQEYQMDRIREKGCDVRLVRGMQEAEELIWNLSRMGTSGTRSRD